MSDVNTVQIDAAILSALDAGVEPDDIESQVEQLCDDWREKMLTVEA